MQNKTQDFLNKLRTQDGQTVTHQAYGKFNGCFTLDKGQRKQFMKLYCDDIQNGEVLSVLEKQNEFSYLLIDIDLKQENTNNKDRLYTNKQIKTLVKIYNEIINNMFDINEHIVCVFEKPEPTAKDSGLKDGFHLIIPSVITDVETRHAIREQAIIKCNELELFNGYSNTIEDIVDKAVVSSNGWFLYGSTKPGCKPYKLTMMYDNMTKNMDISEYTNEQLINCFSVQSSNCNKKYKTEFKDDYSLPVKNIGKTTINDDEEPSKETNIKYTLAYHTDVLNLLDDEWKTNYEKWLKVGFACYQEENNDGEYFDLWSEWSQCNKYKLTEKELRNIWKTIKTKDYKAFTFKSIVFILSKEKPTEMRELLNKHFPKKQDENSYDVVQKKWEQTHFKVMNPLLFCEISEDKLIKRNKRTCLDTFENKYYIEAVQVEGKIEHQQKPFIFKWLKDENILTYNKFDFLPMQETPPGVYNTFKGYNIESVQPKKHIDITTTLIYKHLFNLCENNEAVINYVNRWLGRKLKNPRKLTNTALIFRSIEGCGKDTFFNWFGNSILGSSMYSNESELNLYLGKFNSILENKILCVLNEVEGKSAFENAGKLKDIITRPVNSIENKGMDPYDNTNNIGWVFLTNSKNPVSIKAEDRRFCAIECNGLIANDFNYFKALREEMEDKQICRAWFDFWMGLDTDNYDFTNERPRTNFYKQCQQANIPIIAQWLEDFIIEFNNSPDGKNKVCSMRYNTLELFESFNNYLNIGKFRVDFTLTKFGLELNSFKGILKHRSKVNNGYIINFEELKNYLIEKKYINEY